MGLFRALTTPVRAAGKVANGAAWGVATVATGGIAPVANRALRGSARSRNTENMTRCTEQEIKKLNKKLGKMR